ncbi:MAG TPA: hypothetical protein VHQ70_04665 [Syntrophomonadaceae bacterium]|jgi:hypothetical protein|nr:hypothetical protein [Syntrophomonadaceae bacterium]
MKVYHICEYCQMVYNTTEVEGPEGAIELKGTCEDCSREMGLNEQVTSFTGQHFYN